MICRHSSRIPIREAAASADTQFILKQLRMLLRTVEGHEWHFRESTENQRKLDAPPDTKYIAAYLTSGIESILSIYRMKW